MKYKEYTKEVAEHLDDKYKDLVDNIFANDVAWDLSIGEKPYKVYLSRSGAINSYHGSPKRGKEIFEYVEEYMLK